MNSDVCHHGVRNLVDRMHLDNLQKQDDPCVGHGVGQSQDSTSHDCIAQVEDRHAKGGFPFKLKPVQNREEEKKHVVGQHMQRLHVDLWDGELTSVKRGVFLSSTPCKMSWPSVFSVPWGLNGKKHCQITSREKAHYSSSNVISDKFPFYHCTYIPLILGTIGYSFSKGGGGHPSPNECTKWKNNTLSHDIIGQLTEWRDHQ